MRAKDVDFEVTYINLAEKPDWFLKISPHGKVPVLMVDEQPLYESNAIAEFLEETVTPALHPEDSVRRARNRAWTDYIDEFSGALGAVYYSNDESALADNVEAVRKGLQKLEAALTDERGNDGPFFNGPDISLVDAAYAPFFMRFAMVEEKLNTGLLDDYPRVKVWVNALMASDQVQGSTAESFPDEFVAALKKREQYAGTLFE